MDEEQNQEYMFDRAQEIASKAHMGRMARHGQYINAQNTAIRARGQVIQEEIAQQRYEMAQQRMELDRMKQLMEITKQMHAMKQQQTTVEHTQNALKSIGELDYKSEDYTKKLSLVFAENPMAAKDPIIQDLVRGQIASKKVVDDANMAMYKEEGLAKMRIQEKVDAENALKNPRAATAGAEEFEKKQSDRIAQEGKDSPSELTNKAIAVGKPVTGNMVDKNGSKTFEPSKDGTGTHVNVSFQDPHTGKWGTQTFGSDTYNLIKANSKPKDGDGSVTASADDFIHSIK